MNSNQNGQNNKVGADSPNNLPTGSSAPKPLNEKQATFQPPNYQFKANTGQTPSNSPKTDTPTTTTQVNSEQESKERTTRWLAILGFIAVIVALAWIVILVIGTFVPNLASILSLNVSQTQNEPTITLSSRSINHNEDFTVNWDNVSRDTTVEFTYSCEDGVSFETNTRDRGIQEIPCDTPFELERGSDGVNVTIRSSESRFSDVPVSVSFIPENNSDDVITRNTVVSVTNPRISLTDANNEPDNVVDDVNNETEEETDPVNDEQVITPPRPQDQEAPQRPITTPPQPQYQYVYAIPQSDPNGFTDLGVRYLGVGKIEAGNFIPLTKFDRGENGAIRFAVKNNGTKTSETWTYRSVLPNGQVFESAAQSPLRPNEEATISLGFKAPEAAGTNVFEVTISTTRDTNNSNRLIRWTVQTQ